MAPPGASAHLLQVPQADQRGSTASGRAGPTGGRSPVPPVPLRSSHGLVRMPSSGQHPSHIGKGAGLSHGPLEKGLAAAGVVWTGGNDLGTRRQAGRRRSKETNRLHGRGRSASAL
jgi:hypothetical protein